MKFTLVVAVLCVPMTLSAAENESPAFKVIEVQQTGADEGVMIWRQYFDEIEGDDNSRIVPVILPPLNEASLERLAPMIGGTSVEMKSYL